MRPYWCGVAQVSRRLAAGQIERGDQQSIGQRQLWLVRQWQALATFCGRSNPPATEHLLGFRRGFGKDRGPWEAGSIIARVKRHRRKDFIRITAGRGGELFIESGCIYGLLLRVVGAVRVWVLEALVIDEVSREPHHAISV